MDKNTYKSDPLDQKTIKANSIRVGILKDNRTGENVDKTFFAFIPLVIYGKISENFPEIRNRDKENFTFDTPLKYFIADTLKIEFLNRYKLKNIFISEIEDSKLDYSIESELNRFYCETRIYTYGLSVLGIYTWFFGIPMAKVECELNMKIKILDKISNSIFNKEYKLEENGWVGMFNSNKAKYEIPEKILKNLMNEFFKDFDKLIGL